MLNKPRVSRRNRRATSLMSGAAGAAAVAATTVVATKWRMTFPLPVVLSGLPTQFLKAGVAPSAAAQVSATVVDLTFPTNTVTGQAYTISGTDPAIRTFSGGMVAAAAGVFP